LVNTPQALSFRFRQSQSFQFSLFFVLEMFT
jgi:hypothetical protein